MRREMLLVLLAMLLFGGAAHADEGDDTLKYYLSKSDLVVLGTIVNEPASFSSELGVLYYSCKFEVHDVLKGDASLEGKTLHVSIKRFEMVVEDKHPLLKRGHQSILFLKDGSLDVPSWVTTDFWFGLQYPSRWMAQSLKRLAAEE